MRQTRLLWQLYPTYLIITLICLTAAIWYSSRSLRMFHLENTAADLEARARLFRAQTHSPLSTADYAHIDSLCKSLGRSSRTRITVILASGEVVGDTDENPFRMENHADRPEIIDAIRGGVGTSIRYSATIKTRMMYVAIPLSDTGRGGQADAVIRTAIPLSAIDSALKGILGEIVAGGFVIIIIAAVIGYFFSRRITRPLAALEAGAERISRGDFSERLPRSGSIEIDGLATAMDRMAHQLDDRIEKLRDQQRRQDAMFSSMVESVLALDAEERILVINPAAEKLFGIRAEDVIGKRLQEVIRNPELQTLVADVPQSREPIEGEISLHGPEERVLRVHGTVLHDAGGGHIGALIVLDDMTTLRRLERVRRDFVANVSHELKTPITAIKGFVETLLGGAAESPADAERFLKIVAKHTERLDAIIEDLLTLARIEQEAEEGEIYVERARLYEVLSSAIDVCRPKAENRDVRVTLTGGERVESRINPMLIEQAVVNLIDNAIKYSKPGQSVEVAAAAANGEVKITVHDHGCGIEPEHLPRLFERFYRTDRARSRQLGGTGLGLAIVKHIAIAHRGRVHVESTPGKGSVFCIYLPVH